MKYVDVQEEREILDSPLASASAILASTYQDAIVDEVVPRNSSNAL